ncbi:hypothetical protein [Bacteroides timonensis]|jgi:hypothetical protein|uniref:hypothetical protein n=1 Tax=Bacteroides timonensis TaxID=1470345 RepID=UPI0004B73CAA|nr:hypothetical protein [Bacteroides timonensis]DAE72410.1 MAG TPA: hypothetical protein [Caudoviricetes sp.]
MRICITLIFGLFSLLAFADEDVVRFYQRVEPEKKVLALSLGNVVEVDALLVETDDIKDGVYEVTVTHIDDHLYQVGTTNLYIEMPYCFEYCYSENAILKVKTYLGHKLGTLIWANN